MRIIATFILISLLVNCHVSDATGKRKTNDAPEHPINNNPDSVLYTGWYFVSETATGYKRQLVKSSESYNIEPAPIVTAASFEKAYLFHEKIFWCLFIWLNKSGAQALNTAMQKANGRKLAFILDNQLLRLQSVDDPQFAKVKENVDPRVYGEVLALPCNSFSVEELKNYETILKGEIR
ncbi:hypothetical protein A3860_26535 [Niastella vici]|uniref:Uncharacterized protein n=1 Tax=Niastella vici TaxID=1703345 RepID=A0A1V9FWX6_9BACT|nr:hypothetical protein [Niastella vici]OQP62871.1 hypothetical protein A3860_26535 [Niastella vici]